MLSKYARLRRIGGITFGRIGRLSFSFCIVRKVA